MSTTFLKKETLERKWYVIDAAGKPLAVPLLRLLTSCAASTRSISPPTLTAAISSSSSTPTRLS